jgi:hypothetical protein
MNLIKTAVVCIAVGCFSFSQLQAQSKSKSKSILNSVLNKVVESNKAGDITGKWMYQGAACNFESDNILQRMGGAVAAGQVEKQFDEYLAKLGIKAGAGTFVFNADKTYSASLGKAKMSGEYALNEATGIITLTYLNGAAEIHAAIAKSNNEMKLLFDADNLLKFLKAASSTTNNSTLKAIVAITDAYDGVQLGINLKKQ